ncbi:MAG: amino acid--tRNA ligase-related protein [Thermoproteota archaeon]
MKEVINVTYERASKHFDALKVNRINLDYKFERIKYEEVIGMLEKYGLKWGDDISSQYMKLIEEKIGKKFYFITDWPTILKPFYTYEHENNRNLTKSFDLNYGFLEIASGGERIYKSEQIVEKLKRFGLNVENFETYIKALEAGAPPHAGFGLGLSRLLMILTGKKNIKEVVLFPRDVDRLVP